MPVYNKLVRDKIPAIISAGGKECRTSTISGDALMKALRQKLLEETQEFLDSPDDPAELADILEVMEAILDQMDLSWAQLQDIKQAKREARGGFQEGIYLEWVED